MNTHTHANFTHTLAPPICIYGQLNTHINTTIITIIFCTYWEVTMLCMTHYFIQYHTCTYTHHTIHTHEPLSTHANTHQLTSHIYHKCTHNTHTIHMCIITTHNSRFNTTTHIHNLIVHTTHYITCNYNDTPTHTHTTTPQHIHAIHITSEPYTPTLHKFITYTTNYHTHKLIQCHTITTTQAHTCHDGIVNYSSSLNYLHNTHTLFITHTLIHQHTIQIHHHNTTPSTLCPYWITSHWHTTSFHIYVHDI